MKTEKEIIKDFGEYIIPDKWEDISLKTYQDIEAYYKDEPDKEFNVVDVLDILTDKSKDEINQLPAEFLNSILTKLSFLATEPEVGKPSNKITIDGEEYAVNIQEKLKVGEYVAVDTILKADKRNYAALMAVLCRKNGELYDTKFENEVLDERIKLFEKQPVVNILPVINFFLHCWVVSGQVTQLSSMLEEAINLTQKNIETSVKNGEHTKLWSKWQTRTLKKLRKSTRSILTTT